MGSITADRRRSGAVLRSGGRSPSSYATSSSSAFASSTSFSFSSPQTGFFAHDNSRSASPTRVNLYSSPAPSPNFRFSINRSLSPNRSITVSKQTGGQHHGHHHGHHASYPKKTCLCSPTNHPGSFRCSLHKQTSHSHSVPYSPMRLNMVRSAMKNSLVRIGGVEGEWVKRALTALIRPSSHQQRRRVDFQPRPSRLSAMRCAGDS